MKKKKIMPTSLLLAAILVMVLLHFALPLYHLVPLPYNLLGIIPLAFGVVINLMADQKFHQAQTTVRPFEESTSLIMDGVFKLSRNPMYLGFLGILLGIVLMLGTLSPFLILIIFGVVLDRMYIRVEETMLAKKFDTNWDRNKQRTRRWI